jgi:hypothetical protein
MASGEASFDSKAPDRLRIGTCRTLLHWTFENVEGWTANKNKDPADLILISIFARSARTFEAIVRCLGERGFGEQGLMLNRSLFEDMIDAHWVSINRDLAVQRLGQHDLYSRLLRADTQRKYPQWFEGRKPPAIKVSNGERKELRAIFGRSGSGSWTGTNSLDDRVNAVRECWGDSQETLLFWHDWVQKFMNEVLHPSAFSLGRLGAPTIHGDADSGESFEWHFGSTPKWLKQSLHASFWTFGQFVALVIDEFHPEARSTFNEREDQGNRAFREASHWEKTGTLTALPPDVPNQSSQSS